ncbi:hypothetical protein FF38_01356 [Lucilia cuprina]|uniref:Uncharacterized protein n=1 Tax=Lucilia cuprina TaxID=7375 RepID=A0A0L0C315_LUCCU|nr:hypothetical protein FF38_01356 [Lucilia cuprina]
MENLSERQMWLDAPIKLLINCTPLYTTLEPFVCEVTCPPNTKCERGNICSCIDRLLEGQADKSNQDLPYCDEESYSSTDYTIDSEWIVEEFLNENDVNFKIDKKLSEKIIHDVTQTPNIRESDISTTRRDFSEIYNYIENAENDISTIKVNISEVDYHSENSDMFYVIIDSYQTIQPHYQQMEIY